MELKHLFLENKPNAIISILSSKPWQISIRTKTWGSYGDTTNIHQLIDSFPTTKQNPLLPSDLTMTTYIGLRETEKFQTLKGIYHPDLDKPKPPPQEGFHDEDDFQNNDGPECLGYEFIITGESNTLNDNSIRCEGLADVFDTRDTIFLPLEATAWMREHFTKWLRILNKQLQQY